MFEKYNEKARRALFFARYEASKLGSRVIESEHILLGILREGEETVTEIFRRFQVKPEDIRREIEGERVFVERISSTAELPLSEESKKILAYASHEAESMLHDREDREISTREIGAFVMEQLRDLDSVAYVRFASVYRRFEDAGAFMDVLTPLLPTDKEADD